MNKKGWGLTNELLIIILFLICLLIAVVGLNQLGLLKGGDRNDNLSVLPGSSNKEVDTDYYKSLENELVTGGVKYFNEYYNREIDDTLTIRYTTLYYNNYMDRLIDKAGLGCSGYLVITKDKDNSSVVYSPYIKCDDYTTSGYDGSKDW